MISISGYLCFRAFIYFWYRWRGKGCLSTSEVSI
uniref:Uncharacterized protein n=1 Tax=Rhizophora mucronata TaxID=61149 RepID=A0A2P2N1F3_RHIMU